MILPLNELTAISPIDGRYRSQVEELSNYFSEYAYIKYRLDIEIKYLIELSDFKIIRKLDSTESKFLDQITKSFDLRECQKVKKIETKTKHDLKAIEYYIKEKLSGSSLSDVAEYVHFGLTSEDINNIAIRLMLRDSRDNTLLFSLDSLNNELKRKSKKYKNIVMLARTHGQPAVPTTLGKEISVFSYRLEKEINKLNKFKFTGKLNGAVGNYNALHFAYPKKDWIKFSDRFINKFQLEPSLVTTQINNPEDLIEFFQIIQRINGIALDLDQDMWRYISDGWFIQENVKGAVGSSTMPQKINPILFENSEGNLTIANSLISAFNQKLPLSRLQRDLSGSTISRSFGAQIAHSLVAWNNCTDGLVKVEPNKELIKAVLFSDWAILSEAIQVYMKLNGMPEAYDYVKKLTRGNKLTQEQWKKMIETFRINGDLKLVLLEITPETYRGLTR